MVDTASINDPANMTTVYFHEEIDEKTALRFIKEVRDKSLELEVEQTQMRLRSPRTLSVYFNCPGGDLFSSLGMYDALRDLNVPTIGYVDGLVASGGTIALMGCDERVMYPSSFMLVHQLTAGMWGTHEESKDNLKMQEMLMDRIVSIYKERTSLKPKQLREVLKRDHWMDPLTALESGFVDRIIKPKPRVGKGG